MEYRPLGTSGIEVSALGLGVMTFGSQTPEEDAFRQLDMALDAGVNLFDTAENYPTPLEAATQGRSEAVLGKWIASRGVRDRVVVATKVAGPGNRAGDLSYLRGESRRLDRANIAAAVDASLNRLGTDHIDLYQVHWPERLVTTLRRTRYSFIPDEPQQVPIEETLAALGEQVAAGKIRHLGVCNESPWGLMRYLRAAERENLPPIASIQNAYSLLDRLFENGLAEMAVRERVALLGYSPLSGGLLTGKYRGGIRRIEGSRSSLMPAFESRFSERVVAATEAYAELARSHGIEPAHMALAFARQQPFMTSVLTAASRASQLENNLKSLEVSLPKELVREINRIHDANPNPA